MERKRAVQMKNRNPYKNPKTGDMFLGNDGSLLFVSHKQGRGFCYFHKTRYRWDMGVVGVTSLKDIRKSMEGKTWIRVIHS